MAYAMSDAQFNRGMGLVNAALARLAKVPSRAAAPVSQRIRALVTEQFTKGQDPYGKTWAPLAASTKAARRRKGHHGPPLTDYGKMRRGIRVRTTPGAGIQIIFTVRGGIATFHQFGTVRMPKRRPLPEGNIPTRWREAIKRSVKEAMAQAVAR